jgi:hypothetical protein
MDLASMPLFGEEDNCEQQQRREPAVMDLSEILCVKASA